MNLDKYPTPIAVTYQNMLETENIQLKLRALIKVFSVSLKYSALVVISDYLRLRQDGILKNQEIDRLFVEKIARPSLGHWNNFLREMLPVLGAQKDMMYVPE